MFCIVWQVFFIRWEEHLARKSGISSPVWLLMTRVSEEGREAVRLSPEKTPVGDPREAPRSARGNVRSGQTGDVRGLWEGALHAGQARALREGRLSSLDRRTLKNDLFAFVRSGAGPIGDFCVAS